MAEEKTGNEAIDQTMQNNEADTVESTRSRFSPGPPLESSHVQADASIPTLPTIPILNLAQNNSERDVLSNSQI